MAIGTPDSAVQVEERMKADVAREAPDSNPYLKAHWLRSFIAAYARRLFDFYRDLRRTEARLFPDTADAETAPKWGNIYVGPPNPATPADGIIVGTGTVGGVVNIGQTLTAGEEEYTVVTAGSVLSQNVDVTSIVRSGTTATVSTFAPHGLASTIPVSISGATQAAYNTPSTDILVTGPTTFEYTVTGSPATPATGTILAGFTTILLEVESVTYGTGANLDPDTPLRLQQPTVNVGDDFYVTQATVDGGTAEEDTPSYKDRYLGKIRNPVAHFNEADIEAKAKEVSGVTRVFVQPAGYQIGDLPVATLTQSGGVAKAVTSTPHGFVDGARTTINGTDQGEYNQENAPILVGDDFTFYYLIPGAPASPATGAPICRTVIALGQVRTFFMRDNDADPIPTAGEVQDVKDRLETIRPANTSTGNNIVEAPVPLAVPFVFTEISPNTPTMRAAVDANLGQFFDEQTTPGGATTESAYRAAIQNTVDPDTGETLGAFSLSTPAGDITPNNNAIATLGAVSYP